MEGKSEDITSNIRATGTAERPISIFYPQLKIREKYILSPPLLKWFPLPIPACVSPPPKVCVSYLLAHGNLLLGKFASQIGNLLPVHVQFEGWAEMDITDVEKSHGHLTIGSILCILAGTAEPGSCAQPRGWRRVETWGERLFLPRAEPPSLHISPLPSGGSLQPFSRSPRGAGSAAAPPLNTQLGLIPCSARGI